MSAGLVTINVAGIGALQFWSSDGTSSGVLSPIGPKDISPALQSTLSALAAVILGSTANAAAPTPTEGQTGVAPSYGLFNEVRAGLVDPSTGQFLDYSKPAPVTSVAPTGLSVAFPSGHTSASAHINGNLAALVVPASWTTAAIVADISFDNSNWFPFYAADGTEWTIASANAVAGHAIKIDLSDFIGAPYVRFLSGTHASSVAQTSGNAMTLAVLG